MGTCSIIVSDQGNTPTEKQEDEKMKVTTYCINKGQPSQHFGLKNADENQVLLGAPNNWKTEKGAINWAKKNGFEVK
jgi:hypothetical protein